MFQKLKRDFLYAFMPEVTIIYKLHHIKKSWQECEKNVSNHLIAHDNCLEVVSLGGSLKVKIIYKNEMFWFIPPHSDGQEQPCHHHIFQHIYQFILWELYGKNLNHLSFFAQ